MADSPSIPAADRAYFATKELILSGELAGGDLLSEGDIADKLDLSRTPVREAFLRLATEQLLQLIPKRGAVVVPVGVGEAADVLDVRLSLETGAVQRLVQYGPALAAALAPARAALAQQVALAVQQDVAGFAAADEQFHRAIVTAGGNAIATRFYETLADRQRRMAVGAIPSGAAWLDVLVSEHSMLLDHIQALDAAAFQQALHAHLAGTHRKLDRR